MLLSDNLHFLVHRAHENGVARLKVLSLTLDHVSFSLGKVRIRAESTIALWRRRADHREMMQAQHKNAFSPEDLEIIDSAFTSAWAVLQASTSYQAWSNEDALRIALRKKLTS